MTRWRATVVYRSETGPVDVVHDLDELEDIAELVERGPHWDAIERIEIRRSDAEPLTAERGERLRRLQ